MDFSRNAHPELAGSASFPDLMNDPAYATNINSEGKEKAFEEPDTCRICRGEGSEDDQLFYPCKCSGSIKFVHQSCLVEWLSHSQKKYCELCKTPFRFTKLYDPNMPQDLPAPLFLRQLAIHMFRTVVTWLRFVLVAFVWLGWLPWSMRAIWRALFWLADGRWPGKNGTALTEAGSAATSSSISIATQSTTADVPTVQSPVSSMFSYSAGEPMMLTLIKKGLSTLLFPAVSSTGPVDSNMTTGTYKQRQPSWLSDVKFLGSLTPSPTINNIIIDTLEGQLITLLVVISFILVFLIREWVVQQQPLANIADGEREAAVQLIANNRPNQDAPQPEHPQPHVQPEDEIQDDGAEDRDGAEDSFSQREELLSIVYGNPLLRDIVLRDEANPRVDFNHMVRGFMDSWIRGEGDPERVLEIVAEQDHDGREEEIESIVALVHAVQQLRSSEPSADHDRLNINVSGATTLPRSDETSEAHDLSAFPEFSQASYDHLEPSEIGPLRFGDDSGAGSSQHAFTFNFREPAVGISENTETGVTSEAPNGPELAPDGAPVVDNAQPTDAGRSESRQQPSQPEQPPRAPQSLAEKVLDWFWGDITPDAQAAQERPQQDDEHIVEDPALEAPFIPVPNNRRFADEGPQNDQDLAAAAGEAGIDANDVDAVEEADDLEGILELIGMQGPIFALLQNGVFSALLISFTVAIGIWLPYLWGKIAIVLLANPIELIFGVPMTAVSVVADITLDTLIGSLGYVMYSISIICKVLLSPFGSFVPLGNWAPRTKTVTTASLSLIDASSHRLKKVANTFFIFQESDIPLFSVLSHQALKIHQARIAGLFHAIFAIGKFILYDLPLQIISLDIQRPLPFGKTVDAGYILSQAREQLPNFVYHPYHSLRNLKWLSAGLSKTTTLSLAEYYDLAVWGSKDRVIAIMMGYALASVAGFMYLRITRIVSGVGNGQRVDGPLAEVLHQAGGVMKVILIIGIEMIVFPLYCGSLLDVALLPLFDNATIASRIAFTSTSPMTSLFVHWFIGTCYMFHFALFVSMCRKIMRSGVLYFIRDPDDPTFHPVRDVLERNITTQLRKIAFSAMVYGALVIVCLGGVVWGLYYTFDGVLPMHWSSTAPVLEFPVDLLFYNFIMPLGIKSINPSDVLHNIYEWWFHRCARLLRLTDFFFGERRPDEEGHHVRRTWWDFLLGKKGDIQRPAIGGAQQNNADQDTYFLRDGRFVRAPASDQVRIPKGSRVFVEVTENNKRVDGAPDSQNGLHGWNNEMFAKVYVPPSFRLRIAAFILSIWAFAAVTGVGATILPLVIGRKVLVSYFSSRMPLNDIYTLSAGMCVVGGAAGAMWYGRAGLAAVKDYLQPYLRTPREAGSGLLNALGSGIRLAYVAAAFSVLLPSLVGLLLQLYVLIPVNTYLGNNEALVIHFVQDWTLGVLYVQMAFKFMLWNSTSRPAAALNGVFRESWLKPNVRLATRALLLPITLAAIIAVTVPLALGFVLNSTMFASSSDLQSTVYRYAYPLTLLLSMVGWISYLVRRQVDIWRVNIRDDVYLIGERLHNFSEKRTRDVGVSHRVSTR